MITTKEASLGLGLSNRTIRNYCSKGRLKCEKRGKVWYIEESSLDDVLEVKVIGTEETKRKMGKEYEEPSSKSLTLPPYYLLVRENGYLKAQADIFKDQVGELKNRIKILEEQLTYQKTSCIKRIFKR